MDWKLLEKDKARATLKEIEDLNESEFFNYRKKWTDLIANSLTNEYLELRKEIIQAYQEAEVIAEKDGGNKKIYYFDAAFCIKVYKILNSYGMNVRHASCNKIWYYINVKVLPDIIYKRFKKEISDNPKRINYDRYIDISRRLYFKSLWWYAHLSAQFDSKNEIDEAKTLEVLKPQTTDTIAQLVERSGSLGYRVDFSRALLLKLTEDLPSKVAKQEEFLRGIMCMYTATTPVVEPGFVDSNKDVALKKYIEYLFDMTNRGCIIKIAK